MTEFEFESPHQNPPDVQRQFLVEFKFGFALKNKFF